MSNSLQDQLLNAGLVDTKKAKKISKAKRKAKNVERRSKEPVKDETKEAIVKAQQEKQERDRELNLARKAEADKKAIAAQVIQLIEHYKIGRKNGDVEYNFRDGSTVKKIRVDDITFDQIVRGRLCVARLGAGYELIPKPIADKIRERDVDAILVANDQHTGSAEPTAEVLNEDEAYYAQFEIPDDLMW